jgi:hypothetical protein
MSSSNKIGVRPVDETLNYLKKYLTEPRVIASPRSVDLLDTPIPQWWHELFSTTGKDRIALTLAAWDQYRSNLPQVVEHLRQNLRDVSLLTDQNRVTGERSVRLLYAVDRGDRLLYYVGGNPLQKSIAPSVRNAWDQLPSDFRQFYESFHNGWYYLASHSMGPSPIEDFFLLNDQEWGILEEIGDPGCDLKNLLAVYSNGMGDYVALGVEKQSFGNVLWFKAEPPKLNIDAWAVIDTWTHLGFQESS